MQKNNRNSRDDKSGKPGSPGKKTVRQTKSSRPATRPASDSNKPGGKLFDPAAGRPAYLKKKTTEGGSPDRKRSHSKASGSTRQDEQAPVERKTRAYAKSPARPESAERPAARPYKKGEGGREGSEPRSSGPYKKREEGKERFEPRSSGPYKKREGGKAGVDKGRTGTYKKQEGNRERFGKPSGRKPDEHTAPKTVNRGRKAPAKEDNLIRLNRYISNAGICSRRKADELIAAGVISVNGQPVAELGVKVNPQTDQVRYNGELLKRERMVYVLLNKPKDYITTTDDPQERHTVMHLVEKATNERIYPVGRLDRNTMGLLLLTNDGDLTDKLSHPKNNVTKIYQAELNKNLSQADLNKIAYGLELEDGLIKPDEVSYVAGGSKREIGIQIHSGKNRIVRRIFEHLGYEVVKLDRVIYANLTKKDLPRGRWRYLDEKEVIQLKHLL